MVPAGPNAIMIVGGKRIYSNVSDGIIFETVALKKTTDVSNLGGTVI